MVPPDLGYYTVDEAFKCRWGPDDVRRKDVAPPVWATKRAGIARVDTVPAQDNALGLASQDVRPAEVFQTEQGPIQIGRGEVRDVSWVPSVATLNEAPLVDTRRTAISDRYYR